MQLNDLIVNFIISEFLVQQGPFSLNNEVDMMSFTNLINYIDYVEMVQNVKYCLFVLRYVSLIFFKILKLCLFTGLNLILSHRFLLSQIFLIAYGIEICLFKLIFGLFLH